MPELDPAYLSALAVSAKEGRSYAFSELFAATFRRELENISRYTSDSAEASRALEEIYISALQDFASLDSPDSILTWLDKKALAVCSTLPPETKSFREPSGSLSLTADEADGILNRVFISCGKIPPVIPVHVFESWGNYKKQSFRAERVISGVVLAFLLVLPLVFLHPAISESRTDVGSADYATYDIKVRSVLPLLSVKAELNGSPAEVKKTGGGTYTVQVPENGTLTISAVTLSLQTASESSTVYFKDTDRPELIKYYTKNGLVYLAVRDTYSGIDYTGITAWDSNMKSIEPASIDSENELIAFAIPDSAIHVRIPDKSGNILPLVISPDSSVSSSASGGSSSGSLPGDSAAAH